MPKKKPTKKQSKPSFFDALKKEHEKAENDRLKEYDTSRARKMAGGAIDDYKED